MPLATVTVAGTITAPDGTPFARKTVWFTTTAEMVDAAGNVLYPITRIQARVITGELKAADGTSPLVLVDSDAGLGTVPYVIEESWANGRKFTVNLTASMVVSGHIPYSTLGPVTPAPTAVGPYALLSDVETRDTATLTAAEAYTDAHSGGAVSSVFGRAGTVTAQTGDYTKAQVGLGNVDNTSDANKPVSTAQQTALNGKADLSGPGATVPRNQLPNISGSFWQQVANQAAMLALTAPDADTALVVFRTDTPGTVWFLNPGLNPATLGNWGSYQDDAAGAAAAAQTAAQSFATSAIATQHTTDNGLYAPLTGPFAPTSTGATSATRYVGGTASSAPTTGTFAVGDYVVTQDAKIYVCVSAGTPGVWRRAGSGFLLASSVWTSSTDPTFTVNGSFQDVDASALRMTVPANVPWVCEIHGGWTMTQGTTGTGIAVQAQARVVDSATSTTVYGLWVEKRQFASASGSGQVQFGTMFSSDEQAALGADTPVKMQGLFGPSTLTAAKFSTFAATKNIIIRAVAR